MTPFEEYQDMLTFKMKPVSDSYIEDMALRLIEWALNNNEAFKLSQFYIAEGIHHSDFHRWLAKNQKLQRAHDIALTAIGNRREIGALKRKLDAGMVSYTMAHYDTSWKELAEWRSKLKQPEGDSGKTQIVVIEKFPENK